MLSRSSGRRVVAIGRFGPVWQPVKREDPSKIISMQA